MRKRWEISFKAANESRDEGERECARGPWCASAVRTKLDDGTTERTPVTGPRSFCDADEAIIGDALRAFPATWRRLWPHLLTHITAEVSIRVPFGPNVPIRTDADTILRALVDCALTWHERVAAVDPTLSPPGGDGACTRDWHRKTLGRHAPVMLAESARRLGERVTVLVSLGPGTMLRPDLMTALGCGTPVADAGLGWSVAVAAAAGLDPLSDWRAWQGLTESAPQPPAGSAFIKADGASAGNEILKLDYLARAAMGETNPDLDAILGVECEQCGHRALRRALPPMHEGDTAYLAGCDDCHALYTDEEFDAWTGRLTRFYARLVTPGALARAGLRGDETPAILAATAA